MGSYLRSLGDQAQGHEDRSEAQRLEAATWPGTGERHAKAQWVYPVPHRRIQSKCFRIVDFSLLPPPRYDSQQTRTSLHGVLMALDGFEQLYQYADRRSEPIPVVVAGGADPAVLSALRTACDRGWISPLVAGTEADVLAAADAGGISVEGLTIVDTAEPGLAAVEQVRAGRARMLMKGQISTPLLMRAVLAPSSGLRTQHVICQVVLMEIDSTKRRFLLADTGIC